MITWPTENRIRPRSPDDCGTIDDVSPDPVDPQLLDHLSVEFGNHGKRAVGSCGLPMRC